MQIHSEISNELMQMLPDCPSSAVETAKSLFTNFTNNSDNCLSWDNLNTHCDITRTVTMHFGHSIERARHLFISFWQEGKKCCETLTVTDLDEGVRQCYEGPFEARLVSQICTSNDPETYLPHSGNYSCYLPCLAQAVGILVVGVALVKAVQNARTGNKAWALGWVAVAGAAGASAIIYDFV